jgi:hypothetical protein
LKRFEYSKSISDVSRTLETEMVKSIALDFRPLGSAIVGDDGMMYVVTFIVHQRHTSS